MKNEIAEMLLEIKAVTLSPNKPFTWASGLRSPIYCDNRLVISNVSARRLVIRGFKELLEREDLHPDIIAGTATAGIPHAAWLAETLNLPMIYVRSSEKKHGRKNMIEGHLPQGKTVFLVEDLISTGGSSVAAAGAINQNGGTCIFVASIFTYGLKRASQAFEDESLPFASLTNLDSLLAMARQKSGISQEEHSSLQVWAKNPQVWSDQH